REDEGIDERIAARQPGCHRLADLAREPLHVAKRVEHRADAEQMQSTNGSVVLVDRRRQGGIVGWIAGGEAVEAVHEDDRPVVGAASLLALFLAVLLTRMLVLGVQAT